MIQVINFHHYKSAAALSAAFGDRWLYVGRANAYYKLVASPLGNPFTPKQPGPAGDAIESYRQWLWQRIKANDECILTELRRIGPDCALVCWCNPHPCHADVVKAAALWLLQGA